MPIVTVTSATPALVAGSVNPVVPGAAVAVQQQNADLTWAAAGTGVVATDGTFSVAIAPTMGATIRVLVTPGATYAPGTSAPQSLVSG